VTDEEFDKDMRRMFLLAIDSATMPMQWWWLSFADGDRPEGQQFLGVALVQGRGLGLASSEAWAHGCNPGGEVMGMPFPDWAKPPEGYTNRLLTRAEAEEVERLVLATKPRETP
jgi:hypothetical protein